MRDQDCSGFIQRDSTAPSPPCSPSYRSLWNLPLRLFLTSHPSLVTSFNRKTRHRIEDDSLPFLVHRSRKMSPVADSVLFDTAVMNQLFHLPETLEKLVFPSPRPQDGHGGAQGRAAGEERGFGGVPVDILETSKEYTFFLDVPGLSKTDMQVTLEEDDKILVIKSNGKRKREEGEEEGCRYLRLERKASPKFLRKFRLPNDANTAAITAKCENGVLTVVVQKLPPPEPKTKTVEVAVA